MLWGFPDLECCPAMSLLLRFSLGFLLVFVAFFLIALVLIQRGRGGGLAGAFGGAGGQSAFGTKAGDVFTRITVGVAAAWILLCILAINVLGTSRSRLSTSLGGAAGTAVPSDVGPETDGEAATDPEKPAAPEPNSTAEPAAAPEASEPSAEPAPAE
jgi:preprotein translocase subunit SecG